MKTRQDIEQKIEQTLESLDGIQRAEPQPFFYTRVIGRLQRNEQSLWEKAGSFISRPIVVAGGLVLILAVNVAIVFIQNTQTNTSFPVAEQQSTDNEYILASSSSFYYENLDSQ